MNKFFKKIILSGKVIISIFLLIFSYFTFTTNFAIGAVFLLFSLFTVFILFFNKSLTIRYSKIKWFWRFLTILYLISIFILIGLFLLGAAGVYRKDQGDKRTNTKEAIDYINSRKITIDDVMGKNLPPKPDQKLNDSTIAGIDANNNTIRDDVELEIFKRYPNSAKIRAAMLQYAQALQLELTEVFNSGTLVATLRKESYGSICIGDITNKRVEEVEDLVFNTNMRKEKQSDNLRYMTTYSVPSGKRCDIELSLLPN